MSDANPQNSATQALEALLNGWKAKLAELDLLDQTDSVAAAEARAAERARRRQNIETAMALTIEEIGQLAPAPNSENEFKRGLWPKIIPELIDSAKRGLTFAEIQKAAVGHPLLRGIPYTPNGLRQGLSKLTAADSVRKIGKQYFTPSMFDFTPPPRRKRTAPNAPANNAVSTAILELADLKEGLTSLQIMRMLQNRTDVDFGYRMSRAYSALVNHKRTGRLIREGDIYRLPRPEDKSTKAAPVTDSLIDLPRAAE